MGEFASSHNSLIDSHNEQSNEVDWLKAKVADLEDRSWRNNVKVRCIPEAIQPVQLRQYATDFIKEFLPDVPDSEIVIHRIHRLPKPAFSAENIPGDVLMQVHYYHIKDQFMIALRKN